MLRVYKKDGTITYYWLWMAITFLYHLKSAYASKLGHCLFLHALTNFFSSFSTSVPGTVPHIRNRIKLSKHDFCPQRAQLRGKYTKHDDFFFFLIWVRCANFHHSMKVDVFHLSVGTIMSWINFRDLSQAGIK